MSKACDNMTCSSEYNILSTLTRGIASVGGWRIGSGEGEKCLYVAAYFACGVWVHFTLKGGN